MRELNPACNTVLPAEPGFDAGAVADCADAEVSGHHAGVRLPYDFDSDYLTLHTTRIVVEAARVAKAVEPSRIEVRAQRGATLLSNGKTLSRCPDRRRCAPRRWRENLVGLGIPADRVHVTWQREPDAPDGVSDPDRRRVTINLGDAGAALPSVYEPTLEPGQRTPRDRMIAIADGYFEGIARHDSKLVSSAAGCNRF